jgi:hypothetical protein
MVDMYIRGENMSTVESLTSPPCSILTQNTASIETFRLLYISYHPVAQ